MKNFRTYILESINKYTEVEFICVNSNTNLPPPHTKQEDQLNLYYDLKKIDGVIPYLQNWDSGDNLQRSLAVIIWEKSEGTRLLKTIKNLAKKNNVAIDLIEKVSYYKLLEIMHGDYDNKWVPEEEDNK